MSKQVKIALMVYRAIELYLRVYPEERKVLRKLLKRKTVSPR